MARAVVVGAGLGGLASAIALRRGGWEVVVLERRPRPAEVGAGIALWPNGLRALDDLGMGVAVRKAGRVEDLGGGIRAALVDGSSAPTRAAGAPHGEHVVAMNAPSLHGQPPRRACPRMVRPSRRSSG